MSFNTFLQKIFTYSPDSKYTYQISETQIQNNMQAQKIEKKVSSSLSENLNFLTVQYNALINSDINIRKFTLNAKGKQYNRSTCIYRWNGRFRPNKSLCIKSTNAQKSN